MRKDSKQVKRPDIASIQGYHQGGHGTEAYAFMGFKSNKYFRSDRPMKLTAEFKRPDGFPLQGYGLEIEVQCNGIKNSVALAEVMDKIIFPHFPADLFKMQSDCSLHNPGGSSVECITQIMTQAFIRNQYRNFKVMFNDYFQAFDIVADSYKTPCGMHVNVSNALFGETEEQQTESIRKLYYIINKHYDTFRSLFYRSPNRTHWCGRMDHTIAKTLDLHHADNDHGLCMNLSHFDAGRIEIRLVGGQKNFACFRNTMESVFHVVNRVKSLSWKDCNDLTKIFSGCNQYVFDRLASMCALDSETLMAIHQTVKEEELI